MTFIIGRGRYARQAYPRRAPFSGALVLQGRFVQAVAPGEQQDVTSVGLTSLLDGSGTATPMQTTLLNDVRSDSVFRLSFGIGSMNPTVLGASNVAELSVRGLLLNADDPDFPVNYSAFGADLGHSAGSVLFIPSAFGYQGYVSQAQIASLKGSNQPTLGNLGMQLQVALLDGEGADTIRIGLFPGTASQRVWIGIEEIIGGFLTIQ